MNLGGCTVSKHFQAPVIITYLNSGFMLVSTPESMAINSEGESDLALKGQVFECFIVVRMFWPIREF